MQQFKYKLHHLPPPPGHLLMQSVMHVSTVFLDVGLNVLPALLYNMDCTIDSQLTFLFTY